VPPNTWRCKKAAERIGLYACTQWESSSPSAPTASTTVSSTGERDGRTQGATPSSAVVRFGRNDVGTDFFPPGSHDQSLHADDTLFPRTVVIDAGGWVRFDAPPNIHQIAIYNPGKNVKDVNVSLTTASHASCPPLPLIDDPVLRRGGALTARECFLPWSHTETFDDPGRYLVICTVLPHFQVGMYGWVIVRGRGV
jgi:plastocyanin